MNSEYKIVKYNEENNVCIIRDKYLKYGLSDKDFNILVPVEYMNISPCKDGDTNYKLNKNNLLGIADSKGNIILEAKFSSIRKSDIEGKYNIELNGRGIADMKTGNIDIEPIYDWIYTYKNGDLHVEKNNLVGVINKSFKIILPTEYSTIYLLNGQNYYRLQKTIKLVNSDGIETETDRYGIADSCGEIIVPTECEWIEKNTDSYNYPVIKGGKNYIFDAQTGKLNQIS